MLREDLHRLGIEAVAAILRFLETRTLVLSKTRLLVFCLLAYYCLKGINVRRYSWVSVATRSMEPALSDIIWSLEVSCLVSR